MIPTLESRALQIEELVTANELRLAVLRLMDFAEDFAIQKRQRRIEAISLKKMYDDYQTEILRNLRNGKTQIDIHTANQIRQNTLALLYNIVEEYQDKQRNIIEEHVAANELKLAILVMYDFAQNFTIQKLQRQMEAVSLKGRLNEYQTEVRIKGKTPTAVYMRNQIRQDILTLLDNIVEESQDKFRQISSAQKSELIASDNREDDAKRKNQRIIEALLDLINTIDSEFEIPKKSLLGIESPDFKQQSTESKPDMIQLKQILEERFNISEVKTLCFHLGIPYEDFPGETLSDKAREILLYFHRRNNLRLLTNKIHELRPDITF